MSNNQTGGWKHLSFHIISSSHTEQYSVWHLIYADLMWSEMLKPTEGAVSKLHGDAELNQNMSDVEKKMQHSQKIMQLVWEKNTTVTEDSTISVTPVTLTSEERLAEGTGHEYFSCASLFLGVPACSPSGGGDVTVHVCDINQPSLPTPLYSILVSISVFMAFSTVFHSINSPENSPFSHSVLQVLSLPYWSYQLYVSLWKSPSALI